MRVDSGVAGEGRVVGIPKFHSWGKCTMPLTNIDSDWMSNASSGLYIILLYHIIYLYYIIYAGPLSCILGCKDANADLKSGKSSILQDSERSKTPKTDCELKVYKDNRAVGVGPAGLVATGPMLGPTQKMPYKFHWAFRPILAPRLRY